jgi:hypothetical protein
VSAPARLAGFAAVLSLVFGGAALAGGAIDADRGTDSASRATRGDDPRTESGHGTRKDHDSDVTTTTTHSPGAASRGADSQQPVRGLAVAEDGLRVVVDEPELRRGRTETLRFHIVDDRGRTVRDFDVEHERRMHLIVARRDLTGFQHLHPRQSADASWSADVRLDAAGSYRLFADFARDGRSTTLASDLRVDGEAELRSLPQPDANAKSSLGYDVRLDRQGSELRFTITRDGESVRTEPYLGAGGHLVALREGDLAFLHVHPSDRGDERGHDDSVAFRASFPTAGRYRLFLQFKHEGRVHTVAFTQELT